MNCFLFLAWSGLLILEFKSLMWGEVCILGHFVLRWLKSSHRCKNKIFKSIEYIIFRANHIRSDIHQSHEQNVILCWVENLNVWNNTHPRILVFIEIKPGTTPAHCLPFYKTFNIVLMFLLHILWQAFFLALHRDSICLTAPSLQIDSEISLREHVTICLINVLHERFLCCVLCRIQI